VRHKEERCYLDCFHILPASDASKLVLASTRCIVCSNLYIRAVWQWPNWPRKTVAPCAEGECGCNSCCWKTNMNSEPLVFHLHTLACCSFSFYCATHIHSAVYAVMWCLSICDAGVLCRNNRAHLQAISTGLYSLYTLVYGHQTWNIYLIGELPHEGHKMGWGRWKVVMSHNIWLYLINHTR